MPTFSTIMVPRAEITESFQATRVISSDLMEATISWNSEVLPGHIDGKMSNLLLV